MILEIISIITLLVIALFLIYLVGIIISGEPELINKLASKLKQSNQIMRHIQKAHCFPSPKCLKIECFDSWKKTEEEVAALEKKQSKLVKFLIKLLKKKK